MSLETGSFISDLVATNPTATDPVNQGDDHLRLVKAVLKATFPNINGAVTPTPAELNYVSGVTSALQTQLDTKYAQSGAGLIETTPTEPAVGAGTGIRVDPTDVNLDISGLDPTEGNELATGSGFLVDVAGVMERMGYTDSGFPVATVATTTETLAAANMNTVRYYTHVSGCAVSFNTGVGKVGNWVVLIQGSAAGQVTSAGTATINGANGANVRNDQYAGVTYLCIAANTWIALGDAA